MQEHILLVEDDQSICEMVENYLTRDGFSITSASDGEEVIAKFSKDTFDLILLDIMLPNLDGLEAMKMIREKSSIPIVIISAKDQDVEKALGLGLGVDDYISKPFSMIELLARVKAAIRRAANYSSRQDKVDNIIKIGSLTIDITNFSVMKKKEPIKLTSKEFEILKLFVTNFNRLFTKEQIYHFAD